MKYSIKCSVFRLTDLNKGEVDPKTKQPLQPDVVELFVDRYNIDVTLAEKSIPSVIVEKAKAWMALAYVPTKESLQAGKTIIPLNGTEVVSNRSLAYDVTLPLLP